MTRRTLPEAEQRLAAATATVARLHGEVQQLERSLENARTALHLKSAELYAAKTKRIQLEGEVARRKLPRIGRAS